MRLFYYRDEHGNFGDDLNPWLWSKLIPELLDDDGRTLFVSIGTLLNGSVPAGPGNVVFGSGAGYGSRPVLDDRWKVYCVRGPATARALNLDAALAITDAAALVRHVVDPCQASERSGVVFIPHHDSVHRADAQGIDLARAAAAAGFTYVDPRRSVEDVIEAIRRATGVFTEAMHGAILADAFRVPWGAVRIYSHVLPWKWSDWTSSLGLAYEPIELEVVRPGQTEIDTFLRLIAGEAAWQLSDADTFETALQRLGGKLDELRRDAAAGLLPVGDPAVAAAGPKRSNVLPTSTPTWWHAIALATREIAAATSADALIALAEDGQWSLDDRHFAGRIVYLPDLGKDYASPPTDDAALVAALDRATARSICHVAIAWTAFWWLDVYPMFAQRLDSRWECVHRSPSCRVYRAARPAV